jgi:hypothetical protein
MDCFNINVLFVLYHQKNNPFELHRFLREIKGRFSITNLGTVIYHIQLIMEAGVNNYWELKAIDSIQGSGQIGEEERVKLIRTILGDNQIENVLVRQR